MQVGKLHEGKGEGSRNEDKNWIVLAFHVMLYLEEDLLRQVRTIIYKSVRELLLKAFIV
jgi:hypothetical protein